MKIIINHSDVNSILRNHFSKLLGTDDIILEINDSNNTPEEDLLVLLKQPEGTKKIPAIRVIKNKHGMNLKTAKQFVEDFFNVQAVSKNGSYFIN